MQALIHQSEVPVQERTSSGSLFTNLCTVTGRDKAVVFVTYLFESYYTEYWPMARTLLFSTW